MSIPPHNLHKPRLRHCHSSPQGAPPRKIAVFFGSSGRQSVNLHCLLPKKVSRIGDRSQEDCHFGPFWGSPPTLPRRARAPASWDPVIDLKSLWRSLRSFPHQRWGPQEHKPRDSMGRAAKPEQSAFSAVLGSDCSPRAKGVCRPEATPGQGTEPAWKWPGMGPDPRIRPQILQFPYLF